ncbi:hypothetical protein TWF696_009277 [Orbilia brochopaga]|uniref:Uncharacterized protein n=1 Tax=Orbilia brochopaga TaxID=3140254 RepID=A0AAV9UIA3_9PEZI
MPAGHPPYNPDEASKIVAPPSDNNDEQTAYIAASSVGVIMASETKVDGEEASRPRGTDTTLLRSSPESKHQGGLLPNIQAVLPRNYTQGRWTIREYICIVSGLCLVWQVAIRAKTESFVLATLCGLGLFQLSLIYADLFFWLFTAALDDTPAPTYRFLVYLMGFLPAEAAHAAVRAADLSAARFTTPGPLWLERILTGSTDCAGEEEPDGVEVV